MMHTATLPCGDLQVEWIGQIFREQRFNGCQELRDACGDLFGFHVDFSGDAIDEVTLSHVCHRRELCHVRTSDFPHFLANRITIHVMTLPKSWRFPCEIPYRILSLLSCFLLLVCGAQRGEAQHAGTPHKELHARRRSASTAT